jgi:hypothetical protein
MNCYKLFGRRNTVSLPSPSSDHSILGFSHLPNEPFKQWRHECHHEAVSASESLSTLSPLLRVLITQTAVPTWFICLQKNLACTPAKKTERDGREAKGWVKEVIYSEIKGKMRLKWKRCRRRIRKMKPVPNVIVHTHYTLRAFYSLAFPRRHAYELHLLETWKEIYDSPHMSYWARIGLLAVD